MINGNKVLAITLARKNSKRVPRKNITPINGKPLIEYTIDEAKKSKYIDSYIVSSDDGEVKKICENKFVGFVERPLFLSHDTVSSYLALKHAVCQVENSTLLQYNYIVEIMCTNPLKSVEDIDNCINILSETEADSVVSVVRIWDNHPSRVKYLGENNKIYDFYPETPESRRQDLIPPAYVRNGSIYATTEHSFFENKRRCGPDTRAYIMPEERTINIDEPDDLILAEIKLGKLKAKG